jgi:tRNA A37 N6-isopentenylltransferase MiaA
VDDPAAQRIHNENAERMLLASFVAGLAGQAGSQTRFSNPQSLEQALKIALTVQEAEKQETFSERFYATFNDSLKLHSPGRRRHDSHESRGSAKARESNSRTQTQRN